MHGAVGAVHYLLREGIVMERLEHHLIPRHDLKAKG